MDTLQRSTVDRAIAISRKPPVGLESFGIVLDDPKRGSRSAWNGSQSAMSAYEPDKASITEHLKYAIGCSHASESLSCLGHPMLMPDVQGSGTLYISRSLPVLNSMAKVRPTRTLRLTRSFRFGEEIAGFATWILQKLKGEREPVLGLPPSLRNDAVRLWSPGEEVREEYPLQFSHDSNGGQTMYLGWDASAPSFDPSESAVLREAEDMLVDRVALLRPGIELLVPPGMNLGVPGQNVIRQLRHP